MVETKAKEPALPAGYVRYASGRELEVRNLDDILREPGRWERYPAVMAGAYTEASPPQLVFWVCQGDGIHQGWLTTFAHRHTGAVAFAVVVKRTMGGDSSESHRGCEARPAKGWGGVVPGKVHGEVA